MLENGPRINISKVYIKDLSFESPAVPHIFQKEFQPKVGLNVQVEAKHVQENFHEVTLSITAEAKGVGNEVFFIVEIEQAGLFHIEAGDNPQLDRILKVFCPTVLFPYARQAIDNALTLGGFPPLLLAPLNFEQLSQSHE